MPNHGAHISAPRNTGWGSFQSSLPPCRASKKKSKTGVRQMPEQKLVPAQELVSKNQNHYPNESTEYRAARNSLLAEEIELRRHIERVAAERRALPRGGKIAKD